MVNLSGMSNEDAYSLVMLLIGKMSGKKEIYGVLSELSYILDKDSFLNFITYYGGTTIEVPTAEEFHKASRVLVLYNSYIHQNLPWKESIKLAGYEESESITAKMELQSFQKVLEER